MVQRLEIEGREAHDDARWVIPGRDRKVLPEKMRRRPQSREDVADIGEVRHFFDRHAKDHVAPAGDGARLLADQFG